MIPLVALAMLALGAGYRSIWWLGCGLVVGAVGVALLVGNPIGQKEGRVSLAFATAAVSRFSEK